MTIITTIYMEDEHGNDVKVKLPTKWAICSHCRGNGSSSAYLGAITASDREPGGTWEDPEDFEAYMNGEYDRSCDECGGSGKVRVVDHDQLSPNQAVALQAAQDEEDDYQATVRAERRMGA